MSRCRLGKHAAPADRVSRFVMAGLANVTATYVNLLGYEAPECWVPSLLTVKA